MGNNNSCTIAINLDRRKSFYFSDELVSGIVGLNIMESKIEVDKIYLSLTGQIGYTTPTPDFFDIKKGATSVGIQYLHVPFYSTKIILARPESGQKELVYNPGQYSWPFQIPLTDYLSPTINKPQSYPHVRYYLQVVIDEPGDKSYKRETRYLTVFPRVNLLQNPQCLVSTIFGNHNRKDITLKGTLNKLGYVPGEFITGTLEIKNPRQVLLQHINLSMIKSFKIGPNSRGYRILETTLPAILNSKDEQIRETFSLMIPAKSLPPSYHFEGGIQTTACVDIHYLLKFRVKVEGMFTNFDVDVPITLGTEPNPDQNQDQLTNPLIFSHPANHV